MTWEELFGDVDMSGSSEYTAMVDCIASGALGVTWGWMVDLNYELSPDELSHISGMLEQFGQCALALLAQIAGGNRGS